MHQKKQILIYKIRALKLVRIYNINRLYYIYYNKRFSGVLLLGLSIHENKITELVIDLSNC